MFANFTPILKKIRINLVLSYMIYMCKLQNNKCDWSADHYIVDNEMWWQELCSLIFFLNLHYADILASTIKKKLIKLASYSSSIGVVAEAKHDISMSSKFILVKKHKFGLRESLLVILTKKLELLIICFSLITFSTTLCYFKNSLKKRFIAVEQYQ